MEISLPPESHKSNKLKRDSIFWSFRNIIENLRLTLEYKISYIIIMYSHQHDSKGLYLPSHQITEVPSNVRHESILIPSTSQPSWGGYFIFDLREKSCIVHDLSIQFLAGSLTPQTGDSAINVIPRYTCAFQWYQRIELVVNNNVIDTIYPIQQYLMHNIFYLNEKRALVNSGAGNPSDLTQRYNMSSTSSYWHVPLWSFFKNGHIPLLYPKDDVQLRVYMDTLANSVVGTSGRTYPTPSLSANLVVDLTRLGQEVNLYKLQELNKRHHHYKFNELRYGTFNISNPTGQTSLVLNSITGKVSFLLFTVRNTSTNLNGDNEIVFTKIKDFSILDATSTNITGGQPITHDMHHSVLAEKWSPSSFIVEKGYSATVNNAYMYSFSADPTETALSASSFNHHQFVGNEQLQISWPSGTTGNYQIDVYAYVEGIIESSPSYFKKITA